MALKISFWKYDRLFKLMQSNPLFSPVVVTLPVLRDSVDKQKLEMAEMRAFFSERGFTVIEGYNFETKQFINAKETVDPDIVFYAQPYEAEIPKEFRFYRLNTALFAYIPYAFWLTAAEWGYNQIAHNICWRLFYSTDYHRQDARRFAVVKDKNVCITGYSMADEFLDKQRLIVDPWKIADRSVKRIIWAPHFSVNETGLSNQSNFLLFSDCMLAFASTYKAVIQFAFKPHPLLLATLYDHPDWGVQRADAYYETWKNLENGTLVTGDYVDLFLTSDAMIHDSGSFIAEYLYTAKPSFFMTRPNSKMQKDFSELGQKAFATLYKGMTEADVTRFIEEVVIEGEDPMKPLRNEFFRSYLLPPNGKSTAENILDEILKYTN